MQLQNNSLAFSHENRSLLSAASILSRSPMTYYTTASLDKLTCTDYVDFGGCQDRFGGICWSKNDSKYLDIKLKVFKREDKNEEFRLGQKFTMGNADFNQFIRQKNQLVPAADNFLEKKTKFAASSSIYTVQRHGGATTACSQSNLICGSPEQKDLCNTVAIQGGQPRNLLCSSSSIRMEGGGREIWANCVCQLWTWKICISSWRHDFCVW